MIEQGGGRTSSLTDWHLMNVLSMWACLQDQETAGQWKQVAGWRKICDLALAHLSRLKEYRRGLAEAWPPETNAAARAYVGELDQLIDKVQHTHDTAAANYDALAAATRAIACARADLKPIHDEYAAKLQQKRAYEAILADPKAVAGSRLPERPPVMDADLEQLNSQARSLMRGLSGELQQAQVMLRQPPPSPQVRPGRQTNNPDVYGGGTPAIPPVVPVPIVPSGNASAITHASTTSRQLATPAAHSSAPISAAGPILGSAGTGAFSATPQPSLPNMQVGYTAPGSPAASPPISGIGRTSSTRLNGNLLPPSRTPNEVRNTPPSTSPTTPHRMPPGGLIGGAPGFGLGQPVGSTAPRRVNPTGGVIGRGGAGTAPSGAAGSRPSGGRAAQFNSANALPPIGGLPTSSVQGLTGHLSRHERKADEPRRWDPDNPWETDQGVNPIVRPPDEERPFDPGPAIGFDR